MSRTFQSPKQEKNFHRVLDALKVIGFTGSLLRQEYEFADYIDNKTPNRVAPAAAFAQTPVSYDNACFAVILPNGVVGKELVSEYRALGAPRAFEIHEDSVVHWRISASPDESDAQQVIEPNKIVDFFKKHQAAWEPSAILEAKRVGGLKQYQPDFIDLGLIPAIEAHVKAKLGPLLQSILYEANVKHRATKGTIPKRDELIRLVFRALAGKVMHDREEEGFRGIGDIPDPRLVLELVAKHYGDNAPMVSDLATQSLVVSRLWKAFSFKNLSVEALAFVWENSLFSEDERRDFGIHATPPNVARYVVQRLPIDKIARDHRITVEPCCGSGTFLIAALNRLRELLPPETKPESRHEYFKNMLYGFDVKANALEVARSCLMLVDYPNPDGWNLEETNLLANPDNNQQFVDALSQARIVLCNPPFEAMSISQKKESRSNLFRKGAEILWQVLGSMHAQGVLGFVLPARFIDGFMYKALRRQIAERFKSIELVYLPEGVFAHARFPTVLILAKEPSATHAAVELTFSRVRHATEFVEKGVIDTRDIVCRSIEAAEQTLNIIALEEIWAHLAKSPTIGQSSEVVQRGVEWHDFDREKHISERSRPGFVPGFHTAEDMYCFESPPLSYLWDRKNSRKYLSWDLPWRKPKVIVNAVRKSAGPWRMSACPVDLNAIASQNFTVIWPKAPWTARSIAAVLNGPVANAFVSTREYWKHQKKQTLIGIPMPELSEQEIARLDKAVLKYQKVAALARDYGTAPRSGLFATGPSEEKLRRLLIQIDATVLRGYRLPPKLHAELLEFFASERRLVPFDYSLPSVELPDEADEDQDEGAWDLLKAAINDNRLSSRDRFR